MLGKEVVNAESHFDQDAEGWTLVGDATLVYLEKGRQSGWLLELKGSHSGHKHVLPVPTIFGRPAMCCSC